MKPTCLLHTWRPHRQRPFALVLHLHQHHSSCNLHLQYLAKNQSTQCCQSLVTLESDHPPVLEPHMVLISPLGFSTSFSSLGFSTGSSPFAFSLYFPKNTFPKEVTNLIGFWKSFVCGGNTGGAGVVSSRFLRWFSLGGKAFFVLGFWWLWDILSTSLTNFVCPKSCRMDLPGPTTSVGTRTDYSVGPWDYPACATRHLMAWSTRTTKE
jgi:hypothetical protein